MFATLWLFVWVIGRVISRTTAVRFFRVVATLSDVATLLSTVARLFSTTEDRLPIEIPVSIAFRLKFFSLLTIAQIVRSIEYSFRWIVRLDIWINLCTKEKWRGSISKQITTRGRWLYLAERSCQTKFFYFSYFHVPIEWSNLFVDSLCRKYLYIYILSNNVSAWLPGEFLRSLLRYTRVS